MTERRELLKALDLMSDNWKKQNTDADRKSDFIYNVKTADECISAAKTNHIDVNYALHRWYNFATSKQCEEIFVKFGAKREKNIYHHSIDIYINGIAYDVKLTVYPRRLEQENIFLDLNDSQDRDKLIRWLYKNQSQETRKHLKSRLFIVCVANSTYEKQKLKCAFDKIEEQIKAYFERLKTNAPNKIKLFNGITETTVYSDIIVIK